MISIISLQIKLHFPQNSTFKGSIETVHFNPFAAISKCQQLYYWCTFLPRSLSRKGWTDPNIRLGNFVWRETTWKLKIVNKEVIRRPVSRWKTLCQWHHICVYIYINMMSWAQQMGYKTWVEWDLLKQWKGHALPCSAALCEGCRAVTMHQVEPVPQNTCRLSWFVSQDSTFKGNIEIVHFDNNKKEEEKKGWVGLTKVKESCPDCPVLHCCFVWRLS